LEGAEKNIATLKEILPALVLREVNVFSPSDMALTGGRQVAEIARSLQWSGISDVVIDCSALSRGIVFPLVRSVLNNPAAPINLHLLVIDQASLDDGIVAEPSERASSMHGFKGRLGLESSQQSAVLCLPQLVPGQ